MEPRQSLPGLLQGSKLFSAQRSSGDTLIMEYGGSNSWSIQLRRDLLIKGSDQIVLKTHIHYRMTLSGGSHFSVGFNVGSITLSVALSICPLGEANKIMKIGFNRLGKC